MLVAISFIIVRGLVAHQRILTFGVGCHQQPSQGQVHAIARRVRRTVQKDS